MKKYLLILGIVLALAGTAGRLFCVRVSINPYPVIAQVQANVSVNLSLDNNIPLRGVALWIAHDTSRLQFNSASQGALFAGQNVGWWRVNTTDEPGTTRVECIIFGDGAYTTGPGVLLNLNYTVLAGDFAALQITHVQLYHHQTGLALPGVEARSGCVIIGSQLAYAQINCWLEGPYQAGQMKTLLTSHIPLDSPYAQAPARVDAIASDVVDWVLVELRNSTNGIVMASQSAFVHNDGSVRSPGKPFLVFMNVAPGSYYTVIRHRNHLAIMSASRAGFAGSGSPPRYDMSVLENIYGRRGVKEVQPGIFAMAAGDADNDGFVMPSDCNLQWRNQVGMSGYLSADFNLDGNVMPNDLNGYWRFNTGIGSQVP